LTIVDEQNYEPDNIDLTVINDDINDNAVNDENIIMQSSSENVEAVEENIVVRTITDQNAAESMPLVPNATESMSLERNAAESMVLLTFSSGQNRYKNH
jgi:hypothetical protein